MYATTSAPSPLYRIAGHAPRGSEVQSTERISAPPTIARTIEPPTIVSAVTQKPLSREVYGINRMVYTAQQTDPHNTSRSPASEPPRAGAPLAARARTMSATPNIERAIPPTPRRD